MSSLFLHSPKAFGLAALGAALLAWPAHHASAVTSLPAEGMPSAVAVGAEVGWVSAVVVLVLGLALIGANAFYARQGKEWAWTKERVYAAAAVMVGSFVGLVAMSAFAFMASLSVTESGSGASLMAPALIMHATAGALFATLFITQRRLGRRGLLLSVVAALCMAYGAFFGAGSIAILLLPAIVVEPIRNWYWIRSYLKNRVLPTPDAVTPKIALAVFWIVWFVSVALGVGVLQGAG